MQRSQGGFSLLEVLIATGLTIGVILATTSAVASALHASAIADRHMALNDDALSVLSDVRAVSAYDSKMFNSLAGHTATMTSNGSGAPEMISVAIVPAAGGQNLLATATATQGDLVVTQRQTLYLEAPMPGSSVNQQ
jgi:type II secretory pathway pseudopilin PulG